MDSLIVEAGIRGVAVPLTAAAAGGLIGAALWFKRPPSKEKQRPGVVRALLVSFAVAVLAVYLGLGLIDVAHFPQVLMLALYLALARWRCSCCASGCTWRCCTKRTTRSSPTSRCCARTADMSFPTWRSAPRAVSRRGRRRVRRARRRRDIRPVRSDQEPDGS